MGVVVHTDESVGAQRAIDRLRDVLGTQQADHPSIVWLCGMTEMTKPGDMCRSYADSGERAYVLIGTKDTMKATRTLSRDESEIVFEFHIRNPAYSGQEPRSAAQST